LLYKINTAFTPYHQNYCERTSVIVKTKNAH
jgi:hypothetical protein